MIMYFLQVTVPEEERYEPPVPLHLPAISSQQHREPSYRVTFGAEGSDFSLVVSRTDGSVM